MKKLTLISILVLAPVVVFAAPSVKFEHASAADPSWKFKSISGPSMSDAAQSATITIADGDLHPQGGTPETLNDGSITATPTDLSQVMFFGDHALTGGRIQFDLGKVQPVTAFNSYSWHEWNLDHGSRAPQVYDLYASAAATPNPADLAQWTKLAAVDSRPNATGTQWGGQYGVSITENLGKLGDFRHFLMVVKPTLSPLQGSKGLTNTFYSEIDIHTAATAHKSGDAVVAEPAKVTDIWVVFKTHCDLGYTETVKNVMTQYRETMMDGALKIFDHDRAQPPEKRFVWSIAGWPLTHILGPLQTPERRTRIEQAIRDNAIAVHALPATLHSDSFDLEDLARGFIYSSHIVRKYKPGQALPISAKMTDVPCHTRAIPTVLAHAGVKFFQIGSNANSGYLKVPQLFWWEGADGSRVLCNYTPVYGSEVLPPANWPAKNYLACLMTHDNSGPPTAAEVENVRRTVAAKMPGVNLHFGTMDDFTRAVLAENLSKLPVVRSDMPDTWIHGLMSMPAESKIAHNLRPLEPALDTLDTQLRAWGLSPDPLGPALAEAYENSMLYGEHTWGAWGPQQRSWDSGLPRREYYGAEWQKHRAEGRYRKYEATFDDHRNYARKADAIVHKELDVRLALLAKNVKAPANTAIVYNPLPWPRSGIVELNGQSFLAENIPASGYKVVTSSNAKPPEESKTPKSTVANRPGFNTTHFTATFDLQRGGLSSLIDKSTGRELVDKSSPYALGQFLHERFDAKRMNDYLMAYSRPRGACAAAFVHGDTPKDLVYGILAPTQWTLSYDARSASAETFILSATDTLGLAKGMTLHFSFPRHQATLDVEWRVTEKNADPIPEGGWLCFPVAAEAPKYLLGRLGSPTNPATDIAYGANLDYFCLNTGMNITSKDGSGINLYPIDSPCVSIGEPGLWRYSLKFQPKQPTVFVNLYNNMWATNFPYWIDGSWSSRVRLQPATNGADTPTDLAMRGWESRSPLIAIAATGNGQSLPAEMSGIAVSRPGTLVTAFGQNPDGPGTLLRVWEQAGKSGNLTVTLPKAAQFTRAIPVNLRGEKSGPPVKITRAKLTFPLNAYAPASFVLE